jgi:hypothetical protein
MMFDARILIVHLPVKVTNSYLNAGGNLRRSHIAILNYREISKSLSELCSQIRLFAGFILLNRLLFIQCVLYV